MKCLWVAGVLVCRVACAAGIVETEKTLPLVQDVDVVVIGGSSGAVAAACKAAEAGAKVFVVAPRPYLGEDMAGKLHLRLESGDDARCALEKEMFISSDRPASLPFTYKTDRKADKGHTDATGDKLADGKWMDAPEDSVQYSGDVTVTLDLGASVELGDCVASVYEREGTNGFGTGAIEVQGSADGKAWQPVGTSKERQSAGVSECVTLTVPVQKKFRYLKILAKKDEGCKRQLLGELYVYPAAGAAAKGKLTDQTTPLKVKKALDQALLNAHIPFLTGSLATEPLVDASGKLAGVVIANRSGRQAIRAKVVVDATERGLLARSAGAQATPFPAGTYSFKRVVVAGEAPRTAEGVHVKELFGIFNARVTGIRPPKGMPDTIKGRMFECEISLPMRDGSERSFAEAEQKARDLTFVPTQLESADTLSLVPPDWIRGQSSSQALWQGADALDINVFKPQGTDYLYVLSPMADVSRQAAEQLMRPGNLMALGERVGAAAARLAAQRPALSDVRVGSNLDAPRKGVVVGEHAQALPDYLCSTSGAVRAEARELPVLAECDVVVAGAGTGGGPAGIGAARRGAKTIVCEYINQMGGVETDGLIGIYYWGNRVGFTSEIDKGVKETGTVFSQCKSEWYRKQNRMAGSEIWYGTLVNGVIVENNRITGVVVLTPNGERGVIRCKAAIDATGNAELAALAGETTEFITSAEVALQGVGQTPRTLGSSYTNTDIGFLDDTDAADLCFFALRSRCSMRANIWDQAQVINSRERRRLVGAFYMMPQDVLNERTYPDVVVQPLSNFDSHGHTVNEQFFIDDPGHKGMKVNLPYRCLLPKALDGLLVTGLGISAHRDAMPILRMQPDVQNQGYAAGVAAAMAVKAGVTVRNVDMKALQKHLIDMKILPKDVLTMKDSYPLSDAKVAAAVAAVPKAYEGLSVLLADYGRSVPLLKDAFFKAIDPEVRFKYAHVLGMMGHADGEDLLIEKVKAMPWDKGWNYKGMGQFNRSVSWMDSYVIALGRAKSKKALPVLFDKARALDNAGEFSHFRAVAMALESIGDTSGAPVLSELLAKPGVGGHAFAMQVPIPVVPGYANLEGDKERSACLRELAVARALFRLGDFEGRGERALRAYAADPRGAYAKHAKLVLAGK